MFIQKIYRDHEGEPVSKIANHLQGGIVSGFWSWYTAVHELQLYNQKREKGWPNPHFYKEKLLLSKDQYTSPHMAMRWLESSQMGKNPHLYPKHFVVWLPLRRCVLLNPFFPTTRSIEPEGSFCVVTNRYTTFTVHLKLALVRDS